MVMEILGADAAQVQVKEKLEGDNAFLPETDNKTKLNQGQNEEPTKPNLVDNFHGMNGETKDVDQSTNINLPKDAADEWPAPKLHSFYFVRVRTYDDPQLKSKIYQAEKEAQRRSLARQQILEALKTKRYERSQVISQLKPLGTEDKHFRTVMDDKRKEMEPLQDALGKLRNANNAAREKGMGICSSEEELNNLIQSLHYRIQHESNTLVQEKQLLKEIKQLEGTRDKVIANAAMRAKIQDSLGQKEAIQDQVKLIGVDLDGVRKEQQSIRLKIRHLEEQLKAIDGEISSLQEDLTAATEKKDKAFEALNELRKMRDEVNSCFYQNRHLLNKAKDLATKNDIVALEGLCHSEVEKFMSQWSSNKVFRDDYERRILSSLDVRQLSRDGRMRNPDEKPIISEAPATTEPEPAPAKVSIKQAKEDMKRPPEHDAISTHKAVDEDANKSTKVESKGKVGSSVKGSGNSSEIATSPKESAESNEIDAAKMEEKREEEIAKAKLAFERKRKLAEKAAAKAAVRAQKEVERKLKEKEKRARKKTGASSTDIPAELIKMDSKIADPEEADVETEAPVIEKSKEEKERVRYRSRPKGQERLHRVMLKRKKTHSYWLWAASASILAVMVVIIVYHLSSRKN